MTVISVGMFKTLVRSFVPVQFRSRVRSKIRSWKKGKARDQLKGQGQVVDRDAARRIFEDLRLERGDIVMVHFALSSFGYVEGGAKTIVHALIDVIGEEGTIVSPAYPIKSSALDAARERKFLNIDTAPIGVGGAFSKALAEMGGTVRSAHPTHSVLAWGMKAHYLIGAHYKCQTPCGPGSPFRLLCEFENSKILTLGSPFAAISMFHVIEDDVEFPFPIYWEEPFEIALEHSGRTSTLRYFVHHPTTSQKRIEKHPELEAWWEDYLIQNSRTRIVELEKGRALSIYVKDFRDGLLRAYCNGHSIYGLNSISR